MLTAENPKLLKNPMRLSVLMVGLALAHADTAITGRTLCALAGDCAHTCLDIQGRGKFDKTQQARIRRTLEFWQNPEVYAYRYVNELERATRYAERKAIELVANRPNMFSDWPWESTELFKLTPLVQHYDYTKIPIRAYNSVRSKHWPKNYHLTYSHSEKSDYREKPLDGFLSRGGNVAMVFHPGTKPEPGERIRLGRHFLTAINGDAHDMRWTDPPNSLVALTWRATKTQRRMPSRFVQALERAF